MKNVIAIRREDLSKKGEQRVPITPNFVRALAQDGHHVLVQPGMHPITHDIKRAHRDAQFREAGATVQEDIESAKVIFGLKEVALEYIYPDKVYCCFSHTHKGQRKNRKMLQAFVENRCTLVDYELVVNDQGLRTVTAFTYYAGYAGLIDTLWATGQRLRGMGKGHPFEGLPQAIRYDDLGEFKRLLAEIGEDIAEAGTPAQLPPMIALFLGDGKTSKGAQEIYDILPVQRIGLDEVAATYHHGSRKQVYACVLEIGEMYRPAPGTAIDAAMWAEMDAEARREAYFAQPMDFESNLEAYLPYVTVVLNCVLWAPKYPRLITREMMRRVWAQKSALLVIGDISCDPDGAVEFSQETWIDDPVFVYDPQTGASSMGMWGDGVAVMAVTNLPCEFSRDSSEQFSRDLAHVLPSIAGADYGGSLEESGLDDETKRAIILWRGEFTPRYAYMQEYLAVAPLV